MSRQNERFPSTRASDAAGAPRRPGRIGRAVDHRGSPQTLDVKPSGALGYFVSCVLDIGSAGCEGKKLAAYQQGWWVAPLVRASARVPSMTALFSPGLLRGIGNNRLGEMWVFGIQHSQIVLPMIHMDFVPRITQKLGDLVYLFIMKF